MWTFVLESCLSTKVKSINNLSLFFVRNGRKFEDITYQGSENNWAHWYLFVMARKNFRKQRLEVLGAWFLQCCYISAYIIEVFRALKRSHRLL